MAKGVPYLSNYIKKDIILFKKTKMRNYGKVRPRLGQFEEDLRRFLVSKDHYVDKANIMRWVNDHPWIKSVNGVPSGRIGKDLVRKVRAELEEEEQAETERNRQEEEDEEEEERNKIKKRAKAAKLRIEQKKREEERAQKEEEKKKAKKRKEKEKEAEMKREEKEGRKRRKKEEEKLEQRREEKKKNLSITSNKNLDNAEPIEVPNPKVVNNQKKNGKQPEVIIIEELSSLMNVPMDPVVPTSAPIGPPSAVLRATRPLDYEQGGRKTTPPREQEQISQHLSTPLQSENQNCQIGTPPQTRCSKDAANEPQAHYSKDPRFINVNQIPPSNVSQSPPPAAPSQDDDNPVVFLFQRKGIRPQTLNVSGKRSPCARNSSSCLNYFPQSQNPAARSPIYSSRGNFHIKMPTASTEFTYAMENIQSINNIWRNVTRSRFGRKHPELNQMLIKMFNTYSAELGRIVLPTNEIDFTYNCQLVSVKASKGN